MNENLVEKMFNDKEVKKKKWLSKKSLKRKRKNSGEKIIRKN